MAELVNPFLDFRMSQGWTDGSHKNNPAMDYATPVGFVFGSPAGGVYRRLPSNLSRTDTSAGGHMGELLIVGGRWDRHRVRFCHLDRHVTGHGQTVAQGDVLAATGNTGYVRPTPTRDHPEFGAHVHTYGLTPAGARWNWTLYADDIPAAPARGDSEPFTPKEGFLMALADQQQAQVYDSQVRHSPAGDYYMTDAILDEQRKFGHGLVARTDAANTRLDAVIEMLKVLDPSKAADVAAFEARLRESEARTVEATRQIVAELTGALRTEVLSAVEEGLDIREAFDEAFGQVFANYKPVAG